MKVSSLTMLAATLLISLCKSSTVPVEQPNRPSWTHDEYLELLTLNSTSGWEPMSRVPIYTITSPTTALNLDHSHPHPHPLTKRSGGNRFIAYNSNTCDNSGDVILTVSNFGCAYCINSEYGKSFQAGYLWQETIGGDYPTARWYSGNDCYGSEVHWQGLGPQQSAACDFNEAEARSVLLYQGCL